MAELTPLMEEVLAAGGSVELTATGSSMYPMLLHRISRVRLAPVEEQKVGDVPLYRRDSGAYVLHRIVDRGEEGFVCCGDHQWWLEPGIRPEQVLAVVTDFARRDRWVSCEDSVYRLYWRFWIWLRPLRRLICGGWRRVRRMFRRHGR